MALLVLPAVAPEAARDYGVDPALVGYQISVVSMGMLTTLAWFGSLSRKLGGCRANQIGHGLVASGLLVMMLPSRVALIAGSLAMGLGYGLLTPSSSHLLMRFTPPERRNMLFSIQQSGVPLGGICAALIAPAVAVAFGWRWSLAVNAAGVLAVVVVMQTQRRAWDDDRDPALRASSASPWTTIRIMWSHPRLRALSVSGGWFCWAQFCVATFTVVTCVQHLGMSLIAAGLVLMAVQVAGVVGRVIVGWLADRWRDSRRVLVGVAWLMLATCIASIWLGRWWPLATIYLLFALHGVASSGWPGALLADVARLAPSGQVAMAVSGALIFINLGKFAGPIVFTNVYVLTKSYALAFASIGLPALAALWCLRRRPSRGAA